MSRVAHGRACRQEEMGVGCAYGPIYLCQVWPSGRRTSWRPLHEKREFAATRNCRWRFLELIRLRAPEDFRRGAREPSWMAIQIALSPKCQQQAHLSPSLRKGSRECAPDARLREAIQCEGGKADCFVATLVALTAKC